MIKMVKDITNNMISHTNKKVIIYTKDGKIYKNARIARQAGLNFDTYILIYKTYSSFYKKVTEFWINDEKVLKVELK